MPGDSSLDYYPQVGFSPLIRPFGFHLAVSHPGGSKWGQMPRKFAFWEMRGITRP